MFMATVFVKIFKENFFSEKIYLLHSSSRNFSKGEGESFVLL